MAEQLMRIKDVQEEFGYSRSTLLRYEEDGAITPQRTPGGQRRYRRADIERLAHAPEVSDDKNAPAIYREFGTIMNNRWGQSIYEERLRELKGTQGRVLLREMRMNDPVIAAVFFAVESTLKRADWRVAPASEKKVDIDAAEFVDSCLRDMSFSWNDTLTLVLQMLEQGFSVLELVYKKRLGEDPPEYTFNPAPSQHRDGRIGWRKWSPRPADSLQANNEWVYDPTGGIIGINQELDLGKSITIPINKLLLFRTTIAPANSPWGMPIHRPAYLPYWYSQNISEIEGIGIERDLAGLPVMYLGTDATMQGANSDYEMAKELVTNIRMDEQAGIVIPKPKMGTAAEGHGMLLELLSSGGRRSYNTSDIIERYDKRKALVVLAQFIMLGMDRVGSFALSSDQGNLFNIAISSWLSSIADIINRHAISRLMKMNSFPGMTANPTVIPSPINVPDLVGIASFINQMVEKEVLTPDDELERHIRQIAGLPPMPKYAGEDGNKKGTGARNLRGKGLGLEKAALLVRRVGLATRSLSDLGTLDPVSAANLMEPLVDALVDSMRNEGLEVPEDVDLNQPTEEEILAQQGKIPPQLARGKDVDDEIEEEDKEEDFPDDDED